mmetsp:Transcript_108378/g.271656  ORF Transcript_108378/g.271656 Transcript_108378/m.271656 type:complete len:248 (+) Transcript_108378:781-1524(+)
MLGGASNLELQRGEMGLLLLRCGLLDLKHWACRCRNNCRRVLHALRKFEEALHVIAICGLVQDDLFAELAGVLVDVFVAREAARVHNRHVQALRDAMVQEHAVHGISHRVEPTEGEGQVAQSSTERYARASAFDLRHGIDEVNAVAVVLRQPRGNRQHVAIENDVLRREVQLLAQQLVAALANPHLVLKCGGLTLLIEGHDHHSSTKAHHQLGLPQELLLTYLQGDRVHNALALHTLQALLDHGPLR